MFAKIKYLFIPESVKTGIIRLMLFLAALGITHVSPAQEKNCVVKKINKTYREEMNREFLDSALTPLTPEGLKHFRKLDFYPVKSRYRVRASLIITPGETAFEMQRSKGNTGSYRKYGYATFMIGEQSCSLAVYQYLKLLDDPSHKDDLFLPFADLTNGLSTYGSGRFLELKIPEGDELIIDFNMAFNPLCAYNPKYSCPIPPAENRLKVAIKAGMKNYRGLH